MWNAIKSDLFDFVATISEDTTTTLTKVLGEDDEEAETPEESLKSKLIADVKRSYETYAKPLRDTKLKEYERFKKKFNLSAYAQDIAQVLDIEPEVSRFYAELVPLVITPDEFWARLFFRLHLVTRSGTANFEDEIDEEEELVWEDEDDHVAVVDPASVDQSSSVLQQELLTRDERIGKLEDENSRLKSQVAYLLARITELEIVAQARPSSSPVPPRTTAPAVMASSPVVVPVPVPEVVHVPQLAVTPMSVVVPQPSVPDVATTGPADTSSVSSGSSSSVVVVSMEEAMLSSPPTVRAAAALPAEPSVTTTAPAVPTSTSKDKATAYLASLEDDEDEEDGWN